MLAAIALAAGTYAYQAKMSGSLAGNSTVTVTPTTISEKASGSAMGMQFNASTAMTLDTGLVPTQYDGDYSTGGQSAHVTAAVAGGSATVTGAIGQTQPQTVPLGEGTKEFAVIEPGLIGGLFALPAQIAEWQTKKITAIAPSRAVGETLEVVDSPTARPAGVPAADVALSFGGAVPFTIWYDPSTYVPDEIDVPSQNLQATRVR